MTDTQRVQPLPLGSISASRRRRVEVPWRLRVARWARRVFGQALGMALVILVVVVVVVTVSLYVAEVNVNDRVDGPISALSWTFAAIIGRLLWTPETPVGRGLDYVLLVARPGLFGVLTAAVTAKFLQVVMWRESGLGRVRMRDHIVICGWSSKGREIVDEIRGRNPTSAPPIVVVANLDRSPLPDEGIRFVSGDPTTTEALNRAGIGTARTAIVLADSSLPGIDAEDMDARSLLTVLAIESLHAECYTCVEVVRSVNREHFERTNADELLVSGLLTGGLLAHSAVTPGLSRVIGDLITFPEGNEFYWMRVGDTLAGKTFLEAMQALKQTDDCIVVALARGDADYATNPPPDVRLDDGDRLLVIAAGPPGAS